MPTSFIRDYYELCKPRVVMLMILTAAVGMCLAPSANFPIVPMIFGNLGIALVAGAAAALNHVADQHIDKIMRRTQHRPLVQGKVSVRAALFFSVMLCLLGLVILYFYTNVLTMVLTFLSLIGYAGIYTLYLKHATSQNIVIGGIAGATPPLLGWVAVTGAVSIQALLLVLIIFIWTPPHFWALAIYRLDDYAKANIPMLPHTHGVAFTKLNILIYTVLLSIVTIVPYFIGMSGWIYLLGVLLANGGFIYYAIRLYYSNNPRVGWYTFKYSIYYLGMVFILLLVDHYNA